MTVWAGIIRVTGGALAAAAELLAQGALELQQVRYRLRRHSLVALHVADVLLLRRRRRRRGLRRLTVTSSVTSSRLLRLRHGLRRLQ